MFVRPLKGFHPRAFLRALARGGFHSRRFEKIQTFIDENLIVSCAHYGRSTIGDAELPYDTLICDSDVIWAPSFFGGQFDPTFFMAFDKMKSMKRIAYAASMADLDFTLEQERSFLYPGGIQSPLPVEGRKKGECV